MKVSDGRRCRAEPDKVFHQAYAWFNGSVARGLAASPVPVADQARVEMLIWQMLGVINPSPPPADPDIAGCNTIQHSTALTDDEWQRCMAHWQARFAGDDHEALRIAQDLGLAFWPRPRRLGVAHQHARERRRAGQPGAAPRFADLQTVQAKAKATRAVLLPDRWCVVGHATGRREVFRVWGQRIADALGLSPDWRNAGDPEPLLGGERAWLVDFDEAVKVGMALKITQQAADQYAQQHLAPGFNLAIGTLERPVVLGLDWTKRAEASADGLADLLADQLADLLAAQRDSEGLAFVGLGTPTNNPEGRRRRLQQRRRAHGADQRRWGRAAAATNRRAATADQRTRPAGWSAGGQQHLPDPPGRAAHRATHDECAVARHLRPLFVAVVDPRRRRRRHPPAQNPPRWMRCAAAPWPSCALQARCRCCAWPNSLAACCRWWAGNWRAPPTAPPRRR